MPFLVFHVQLRQVLVIEVIESQESYADVTTKPFEVSCQVVGRWAIDETELQTESKQFHYSGRDVRVFAEIVAGSIGDVVEVLVGWHRGDAFHHVPFGGEVGIGEEAVILSGLLVALV